MPKLNRATDGVVGMTKTTIWAPICTSLRETWIPSRIRLLVWQESAK